MRIKDASRIFSSAQLQAIARGDMSFVRKIASNFDLNEYPDNSVTLERVFESVFSQMWEAYRNEYVFKNRLIERVFLKKYSNSDATLLTELRVGRCVADAVLVNGLSTCFEIKTEYDSLSRLSEQVSSYRKLFDKIVIISSETHIQNLLEQLPSDIGLNLLTKRGALVVVRKPEDLSSGRIDTSALASTLRLNELKALTKSLTTEKLPSSNIEIYNFCNDVLENSDPVKVRNGFRKILKTCRKQDTELLSSVPKSLKNALVSYKFSAKELHGLLSQLKTPVAIMSESKDG
jgi:hypothetical protein